jgi:hypothetical protein
MAKDKRARRENRVTVTAMANMLAAMIDAMRAGGVSNDVTHGFLDKLEWLNAMTLTGYPAVLMAEFVEVMRCTVASND